MARPTIKKDVRLRLEAYTILQQARLLPQRSPLRNFLESQTPVAGMSSSDFSNLLAKRAVSRQFASGVVTYVLDRPEVRIPTTVREKWERLSEKELFDVMFETLPDAEIAMAYRVDRSNDPAVGFGFTEIAGAVVHTIFSMGRARVLKESDRNYIDDVEECLRLTHIDLGFALTKTGDRSSVEEAYKRGLEFTHNDDSDLRAIYEKLLGFSPDCLRNALCDDGRRVGFSCAFAITDAAYEATLRGEHDMYSYTSEDIVQRGNNIVLFVLAEIHDTDTNSGLSTMSKRKNLIGSLLLQIARLLDTDNRKPIRAVSYEIHPGNTKRLRSMGFQPVRKCTAYGDVPINVVVFDPTRRSWLVRNAMLILDDFVWRIRTAFDGMEQMEATMDG